MASSIEEWIDIALKTPFTKIKPNTFDSTNPGQTLLKLKKGFETKLSELDTVLEPLLTIFNNKLHNPNSGSLVIGLLGNPGVGKTHVGQVISEVWNLPFHQISLGGIMDSSILDGQHPSWLGSSPGRFAKAMQEMGYINGVIFLDEIDKLGESTKGLQVQYSLLHSMDPTQNNHYTDNYLGSNLPLDLSKCLIICALNKTEGLDPALLNRMNIINVPDYTEKQKTSIMLKHLFPLALKNAGLTVQDIYLPEETCSSIQDAVEQNNGKEGGVRGVKMCLQIIVDKLSLLLNTTIEEQTELKLSFKVNVSSKPIVITTQIIKELYKTNEKKPVWENMYI